MKILAIETSCDETALAFINGIGDVENPKFEILATALYSQALKHAEYGGVFPSLAKREHALNLVPLLGEIFTEIESGPRVRKDDGGVSEKNGGVSSNNFSHINWNEIEELLHREQGLAEKLRNFVTTHEKPDIDMLAVTSGPGLEPALWVGINFARALSIIWQIPLLPVNHMEGHIISVLKESEMNDFPALALLISGGHTELILINNWGDYKILGQTKDDAVGEAYDKVARILGIPYPGGVGVSRLAEIGREKGAEISKQIQDDEISFPRPMISTKDYDFSLSGLKTAVLYKSQKLGALNDNQKIAIAHEFEQSIVDVLKKKTGNALAEFGIKNLIVGGGVIANQYIREELTKTAENSGAMALFPEKDLSTDNAIMIAMAGFLKQFREKPEINKYIVAEGGLSL